MAFDPESSDESKFTDKNVPKNYGRFYSKWIRNNFQSKAQGREVGENKDYVLIISPGMLKSEVHREATADDRREFREEWEAYQKGQEQRASGTPIEMLPGLDPGRRDSLKVLYIHTIEQLAGLGDGALQSVGMGGQELRERAKKYLAGGGDQAALRARIASLEIEVEELMTENLALHGRLQSLQQVSPRGNGKDVEAREVPQ